MGENLRVFLLLKEKNHKPCEPEVHFIYCRLSVILDKDRISPAKRCQVTDCVLKKVDNTYEIRIN